APAAADTKAFGKRRACLAACHFEPGSRDPSQQEKSAMKTKEWLITAVLAGALAAVDAHASDALPSWSEGQAKRAVIAFVERVTEQGSPDFVPEFERIAVFDNDGTLWSEQPIYVQLAFALDRVKALLPQHPEWKDRQPFKSVLEGDLRSLAEGGERELTELIAATPVGNSTEEFERIVTDWI